MSASATTLPVTLQTDHPLVAASNSATTDPTTIIKQPENAGPGNLRVAQTMDRIVIPMSRLGSPDSAVTYSSDGQATVASLSRDITFDVDSSALADRAKQMLDEIVKRQNGKPPVTITAVRHTDPIADDAHSQTLFEQRAKATADYLTSKAPSLNVQSSDKRESEPVASETSVDGSVNGTDKVTNRHVGVRWG